ncbi:MAG: flagellar biosynthesis protein FlhB [Lachnospiraceae bacterium]|nr:flagellar biosynthesis protein FlhB [Lachnospiraceae bacterium]
MNTEYYSNKLPLRYNLQFFANDEGGEKTEEATPKKLDKAREDGKVAKSKDIPVALTLLTMFVVFKFTAAYIGQSIMKVYEFSFGNMSAYTNDEFNTNTALSLLKYGFTEVIVIAGPLMLCVMIIAFFSNSLQIKWKITAKPMKPKFSSLNPISGFKRLISKDKVFQLILSVVKIVIMMYVIIDELFDQWGLIFELYRIDLISAVGVIGDLVIGLGIKISLIFLIISAIDFIYQKFKFKKDMRMSKQEVKDEYKNAEGDPKVKGQIKQRMMQASQRRMMQKIPQADVVITNPTHLAVALRYDREHDEAPVVIAKGADYLAEKIKENARQYNIEIVENKPLARMLYYNVDLDEQIPPELYQMVAEVLAFVFGLKGIA